MRLSEKQAHFAQMVACLIMYAHTNGYRVTLGEAYRFPQTYIKRNGRYERHGHIHSLHQKRLAIDLNLFKQGADGKWRYCRSSEDHEPLGIFWESLGGSWGGRFSNPDGNHYSLEHGGQR